MAGVQTFLPYPDFARTMRCLDRRRLGKQRVEAWQILKTLARMNIGGRTGWSRHPAVLMWRGYSWALQEYYNAAVGEWVDRGYRNYMREYKLIDGYEYPPWLGDERLHSSHRARLLHKDPEHYGAFGWDEEPVGPDVGYWWPVRTR